tara:strand:+ start:547 stop:804 length:258 start_codon:yes stop_codon:yes gene_type:complete
MKLLQIIAAKFLSPQRLSTIRQHSDRWQGRCENCGEQFSAWDAGAIIWKDVDRIDQGLVRCPHCEKISLVILSKVTEGALRKPCE